MRFDCVGYLLCDFYMDSFIRKYSEYHLYRILTILYSTLWTLTLSLSLYIYIYNIVLDSYDSRGKTEISEFCD